MLSFVIPVLNEAAGLPGLLAHVRQRFPDAELIVVDGGSSDGSIAAAIPHANCVLLGPRGRAAQMNLGARCARGEWLVLLHGDTLPDFDEQELLAALGSECDWGFCSVRLRGDSRGLRVVASLMNRRSRLTQVATGDQMLLVRRQVFDAIGGFADLPLMEDVEICKRLRQYGNAAALPLRVTSSGRRWDEQGLVKTVVHMWGLRLAYWLGVSPQRLWDHYYGSRAPVRRNRKERAA